MKTFLLYTVLLSLGSLPFTLPAHEVCRICNNSSEGSLEIDFGYRRDSLQCLVNIYNPPGNFIASDDLKIKKIRVIEGGLKGQYLARDSILLKGFCYGGEVESGKYLETAKGVGGIVVSLPLKVNGGQTLDASVGGGYLFSPFKGIKIGPTIGWSYNSQYFKMKGKPRILDGLQYTNIWQGSWVGADMILTFCDFGVHMGYEYHLPRWSGEWLLKGNDVPGNAFSDMRHANHGYGNVAFIEVYTLRFCSFSIHCQGKWQYWKMNDGKEHPKYGSFASVGGGVNQENKIKKNVWKSLEATVGLAYRF